MNTQIQGRKGRQHRITRAATCTIGAIALLYAALTIACGQEDTPVSAPPATTTPAATATATPPTPTPTATPQVPPTEPAPRTMTLQPAASPPAAAPTPTTTPQESPPTPTAPAPAVAATAETPTVGWWKDQVGHDEWFVDYTPAGILEQHPYGPQLDLLDGRFDYHDALMTAPYPGLRGYSMIRDFYIRSLWSVMKKELTAALRESTGNSTYRTSRQLRESMYEPGTIKWEVVDIEEPVVMYWVEINGVGYPTPQNYRVGFTVRYEIHEEALWAVEDAYSIPKNRPPLTEYLGNPAIVSDFVLEKAP